MALLLVPLALVVAGADCGEPVAAPSFQTLRTELFEPRCGATGCHGGNPARELDLVTDAHGALVNQEAVGAVGRVYVVPGDPEGSLLLEVLRGPIAESSAPIRQMPVGVELPVEDIEAVEAWIREGARND